MRRFKKSLLICAYLLAAGCQTFDESITEKFSPVDKRDIDIRYEKPGHPYIQIGTISYRYSPMHDRELILQKLIRRAAHYGAQIIVPEPVKIIRSNWSYDNGRRTPSRNINETFYEMTIILYRIDERR